MKKCELSKRKKNQFIVIKYILFNLIFVFINFFVFLFIYFCFFSFVILIFFNATNNRNNFKTILHK